MAQETPETASEARLGSAPQTARNACDAALHRFLNASDRREAERRFDRLDSEFISPVVTSVLSFELRRGPRATPQELFQENDTFRDLSLQARGKLAGRLMDLWQQFHDADASGSPFQGEAIMNLRRYTEAIARHACVDYLRRKFPGRHSLDTVLRAVLDLSDDLDLWQRELRPDFYEWLCGWRAWRETARQPVFLHGDPSLQARLRRDLEGLKRAQALRRVFEIVRAPLRYDDLVNFLADFWDVEAPYRAAARERADFRVPKPYLSGLQPEEVVQRLGTLQAIWERVRLLKPAQAATLLLKLPQAERGSYLDEMVRLGVASEPEIAAAMGLSVQSLRQRSPDLPLEDVQIAEILGVEPDEVRRIRQDARRRLERQQPREQEKK